MDYAQKDIAHRFEIIDRTSFNLALMELNSQGQAFYGEHTHRETFPGTAHHDTKSIYLRWAPEWSFESIFNTTDAVDYPAKSALPMCWNLALEALRHINATEVGRVMIVSLKKNGVIDEHSDEGSYAEHFDRYHIPLKTRDGNIFCVDGHEPFEMFAGSLYWFNHRRKHWASNNSDRERVHLIIDAVSPTHRALRKYS